MYTIGGILRMIRYTRLARKHALLRTAQNVFPSRQLLQSLRFLRRASTAKSSPGDGARESDRTDSTQQHDGGETNWLSSFKRTARFGTIARKEIGIGLLFLPLALSSTLALPFFVGNIIDLVVGPFPSLDQPGDAPPGEFFGGLTHLQAMVGLPHSYLLK